MRSARDTASAPSETETSHPGHTSVYLVDDHPPIRKAIEDTISSTMDIEVVGGSGRLEGTWERIEETAPDVVVVDISLPDGHGLDLVKRIREHRPDIGVLVFSMYDEDVYAERALRTGASGYLMKTESIQQLVEAIRRVERGEVYLSRQMATQILTGTKGREEPSFAIDELTNREFQVFQLLGRGQTVEDIQNKLDLSRKTVETYRRRAKEKLGFDSVSELLQHAVQWTYVQEASQLQEEPPSDPVLTEEA